MAYRTKWSDTSSKFYSRDSDLTKVRKTYTNIKAQYVSATKKDKYSTGGGTRNSIMYSEYMDQLVGTDNPVTSLDIQIDGGDVSTHKSFLVFLAPCVQEMCQNLPIVGGEIVVLNLINSFSEISLYEICRESIL